MGKPYTYHLYCHLVWAIWERLPLITPDIEPMLYTAIAAKCRELGAEPLAIGGLSDHVHLLVRFPRSLTLATLTQEVKGASSHLVTHKLKSGEFFKWQGGYGAFTVSLEAVPAVREYIQNQKKHHAAGTWRIELERTEEVEKPSS